MARNFGSGFGQGILNVARAMSPIEERRQVGLEQEAANKKSLMQKALIEGIASGAVNQEEGVTALRNLGLDELVIGQALGGQQGQATGMGGMQPDQGVPRSVIGKVPAKPENVELTKLQNTRDKLLLRPVSKIRDQKIDEINKRIDKLNKPGGQTINIGGGDAFYKELSKQFGKDFVTRRNDAIDAARSLKSANIAVDLMNKGIITGTGANFILGVGKALKQAGLYDGQALANTEAYFANQVSQVASIIKAFGSGTGLSDADREYAQNAAAGNITMTEESLRKIIDINARASTYIVNRFNEDAKKINERGAIPYDLTVTADSFKGSQKRDTLTDEEYEERKRALGL